jgi:apolipoprotein N-acyltransferase
MLTTLFRVFGLAGIVLLGAALAIAPIAAFENRMTTVSALGIAGIACLLVAWGLRRIAPPPPPASGDEPPTAR